MRLEIITSLAGPGADVAKVAASVYSWYKTRVQERVTTRLQQVTDILRRRIDRLEDKAKDLEAQPERGDLFMAALRGLIEDDDDRKTPYYAAFLEHLLTQDNQAPLIRLAGEALRTLTFEELAAVPDDFLSPGRLQRNHAQWVGQQLPSRLQALGLYPNPSTLNENLFTPVGKLFCQILRTVQRSTIG